MIDLIGYSNLKRLKRSNARLFLDMDRIAEDPPATLTLVMDINLHSINPLLAGDVSNAVLFLPGVERTPVSNQPALRRLW